MLLTSVREHVYALYKSWVYYDCYYIETINIDVYIADPCRSVNIYIHPMNRTNKKSDKLIYIYSYNYFLSL